jgi:hypothetical protein
VAKEATFEYGGLRSKPMRATIRGGRRRARPPEALVVVPILSPRRQVKERRVLMKPHDWTRAAVAERVRVDAGAPDVEQPWDEAMADAVVKRAQDAAARVSALVEPLPTTGDHLRLQVLSLEGSPEDDLTRLVAACCSATHRGLWLTFGKLAVCDTAFWRLGRGMNAEYQRAKDVHLPRDLRATVRDLLRLPPVDDER